MSIVPQFYLNAVVSIGTRVSDEIKWIGTGFFALRKVDVDGSGYPFLITNKHVVIDEDAIVIRIRKKGCEDFDTVDVPLKENGRKLLKLGLKIADLRLFILWNTYAKSLI
mgnify:CR=1 FL=1